MKHDFEDENEVYDEAYHRRRRAEMVKDGEVVRVPFYLMDGVQREVADRRYALKDGRSDGVRLRDESYALMVDRMRNPKSYDQNGRRIVSDGIVDDLSEEEIFRLAQRLSGPMAVAVPTNYLAAHSHEANEEATARENSVAGPSRDNRRPHYPKPIRDRAVALRLRDESYALMVDRMRNPKNYDKDGRKIASSSAR
jgi:hypothetical protein